MPRLLGGPQTPDHSSAKGVSQLLTRGLWALDKATGGRIGPSAALPFAAFERRQLPQLREQAAVALAALPGLSIRQHGHTLDMIMQTASQAYDSVCTFQADHADGLGRRSSATVRGSANQNMWNKQDASCPFMQVVGGQVKALVEGLVTRVAQELGGQQVKMLLTNGLEKTPSLSEMVRFAKAADPAHASSMPFVASRQCSSTALKLAKDHLAACVVQTFMTPDPAKLQQDARALVAITTDAHRAVVDLVSQPRTPLDSQAGAHLEGATADLSAGVSDIVGGMNQRVERTLGPWLGLSKDQAAQRDQQAADRGGAGGAGLNTGRASRMATTVLRDGLQAAALEGPVGPVSAALWRASSRLTYAETQKIKHQAADEANLASVKVALATLQPLVNERVQDNEVLWGRSDSKDFQTAAGIVCQAVQMLPKFKASGLEGHLPDALKNATPAQTQAPVLMADLMTRLALEWEDVTDTSGLATLERGFNQMLEGMNKPMGSSAGAPLDVATIAWRLHDISQPPTLSVSMMLGGRAAAAQVLSAHPQILGEQQDGASLVNFLARGADAQGAVGGPAPLTPAQELVAHVESTQTSPTQENRAKVLGLMSIKQTNAANKITDKAVLCGRQLVSSLLEASGDKAGLKALRDVDMTSFMADIDRGATPLSEGNQDERSEGALKALLQSVLLALPRNLLNAPVLDPSTKSFIAAFFTQSNKSGLDAETALKTTLDKVNGGPAGAVMAHLRAKNLPNIEGLSSKVMVLKKEILSLTREVETLRADAKALIAGDFDEVKDEGSALKNWTHGALGRGTATAPPLPHASAPLFAPPKPKVCEIVKTITGVDLEAPLHDGAQARGATHKPGILAGTRSAENIARQGNPQKHVSFAPPTPPISATRQMPGHIGEAVGGARPKPSNVPIPPTRPMDIYAQVDRSRTRRAREPIAETSARSNFEPVAETSAMSNFEPAGDGISTVGYEPVGGEGPESEPIYEDLGALLSPPLPSQPLGAHGPEVSSLAALINAPRAAKPNIYAPLGGAVPLPRNLSRSQMLPPPPPDLSTLPRRPPAPAPLSPSEAVAATRARWAADPLLAPQAGERLV